MNTQIKAQMGWLEWAMLITLSIFWGGSFFFTEIILQAFSTLQTVFLRIFLGGVVLWIIILIRGDQIPRSWKLWLSFLIMGMINNVIPFLLIVWGQTSISGSLASILNATVPLFTVVVASALLADERVTTLKVIGLLLGFAGVVIMLGYSVLSDSNQGIWGQVTILGAALSYGFAGVFGRRFKEMGVPPMMTAAGQIACSSLILGLILLYFQQPVWIPGLSLEIWGAVFGISVFSTALAYILFFRILATAGATNLSLVTFLIPVSAIILGTLLLNESLTLNQVIGMLLIGSGLAFLDGRLFRPKSTT